MRPAGTVALLLIGALPALPAAADPAGSVAGGAAAGHDWGFEVKGGYRDSEQAKFPSPFPFPPSFLPVGQTRGFLETVDEGGHLELAVVTLFYKGAWENGFATKVKVDLIDKWDRNPTSSDRKWDVDEAWIRWGPEVEPAAPHEGHSGYVKLGKFPKFERQDDRHLESYGLVSTAFNRMEDVGLEVGFDFGPFYVKSSLTQGNPLFIRDVNALAGDNGTPDGNPAVVSNPDPKLKSGLPIFYDADVDELDFANPESGLGVGYRFGDESGRFGLDLLAWGYARDLAERTELHGTFYGGDLDIMTGPFPAGVPGAFAPTTPPALRGKEKREFGANVWLYAGGFSLFGQYVDQELANLPRTGYELEAHYEWETPYLELFGQQVFSFIAPAIRYSKLEPDYQTAATFPAPSVMWEWEKIDIGVRLGLVSGLDMTLEFNDSNFWRQGKKESEDEYLATFRYNWARQR